MAINSWTQHTGSVLHRTNHVAQARQNSAYNTEESMSVGDRQALRLVPGYKYEALCNGEVGGKH